MLLSIVIPVYNRQERLDILISGLSNAIMKSGLENDLEIIVIDDLSLIPIKKPDFPSSVSLIRNNVNSGAPFSREQGFQLSKGKFIHFHDSDDSVDDNWLKLLTDTIKENPQLDLLMTARIDKDESQQQLRLQKYFHQHVKNPRKIQSRLVYRNCMGPLGGVTFSRRVLEQIDFKNLASCQDWQMYIDAIKHSKVLVSRPDIKFIFNKTGDDRISHNPRKKILGHLQLAKVTGKKSPFGRNIRLFYLYTCKQHINNKGGSILRFYKKNRFRIIVTFLLVSLYWRLT